MPTASDFVDELLRRTRDPGATATERPQVLRLLSEAQRTVNKILQLVLEEREFTLEPQRAIYDLQSVGQILGMASPTLIGIRYEGEDLIQAGLGELGQSRPAWLRDFAPQPHSWMPMGGNLFAVWPAPQAERLLVTLVLVKALPDLEEGTPIELPEEFHNQCLALAETLLWIRRRVPEAAVAAFQRAQSEGLPYEQS